MNSTLQLIFVLTLVIGPYTVAPKSLVAPGKQDVYNSSVAKESQTTKRSFTCHCTDTVDAVCANNGVTYENKCRFECAKHKVPRLRVVMEGACGKHMSKLQFWSFTG